MTIVNDAKTSGNMALPSFPIRNLPNTHDDDTVLWQYYRSGHAYGITQRNEALRNQATRQPRTQAGRVLRGVDKGTRMPAPPAPLVCVESGTQMVGAGVSVVGVQIDISRVQVVRETTYASMAT